MQHHRLAPLVCLVLLLCGCLASEPCTFITQRIQCKDLTCNVSTKQCVPCTEDAQCYDRAFGCLQGKCTLKPLKDNFNGVTILAPIVGFLVCAIAVIAGVGGGAIIVPLLVEILGVPMSDAVGLAQATICGQSLLNVYLQFRRTHPNHSAPRPTHPLINYEYCSLLLPIALSGTLLGSMGNKVSPDWLRIVLLIVIFSYVLFRLIRRIIDQRSRDKDQKLLGPEPSNNNNGSTSSPTGIAVNKRGERSSSDEGEGEEKSTGEGYDDEDDNGNPNAVGSNYNILNQDARSTLTGANAPTAKQHQQGPAGADIPVVQEKTQYPLGWIAWIAFTFAVFFVISYAKQQLVTCGSTEYIIVVVSSVVAGSILTYVSRVHLGRLRQRVLAGEVAEYEVPFKWNFLTTVVFPLICIIAGFAASMLGIGGGLVFSSLLLEAGLTPEAASATGGLATLLVAVQSAADFAMVGELRYDYGLMMFGAGILSCCFGQFVLMAEIKKRGASYLIVAALATIMGGSMLAVIVFGIANTIDIEEHQGSLGFGQLC